MALLATTVWLVPFAASANSAVVVCGQRITHNVRLANDLRSCPADGLIIDADHITIDLGGHSVDGVNSAGSEGIADDGHRDVHIGNGVTRDFLANGVALRNAPDSGVHNLTIERIGAGGVEGDASAGVLVKDSPRSWVIGSRVSNDVSAYQSDGVDVLSSPGVLVADNRLTHNAWDGMFVLDSARSRVLGNGFDHNMNQGMEINLVLTPCRSSPTSRTAMAPPASWSAPCTTRSSAQTHLTPTATPACSCSTCSAAR